MSDQFKITVTADTTQATSALGDFVQRQTVAMQVLSQSGDNAAEKLHKTADNVASLASGLGELSTKVLALGGVQMPQLSAAANTLSQSISAISTASQLTGVAMGTLSVVGIGIAAVAATGAAAWSQYKAEVAETKSISDSFGTEDKIAARLKEQIQLLLQAKKLTQEQADAMNLLLASPTWDNIKSVQQSLRPVIGNTDEEDAAKQYRDLVQQINIEAMSGFEKERAEVDRNLGQRQAKLNALATAAGKQLDPLEDIVGGALYAKAEHDNKIREIDDREAADKKAKADELSREQQAQADAAAEKQQEADQQKQAALEKQQEALQRVLRLQQEISQLQSESALKHINENPFLTGEEKNRQSIPVWQDQMARNAGQIDTDRQAQAQSNSEPERLQFQLKINQLLEQQDDLQNKINAAQGQDSLGYQFQALLTHMRDVQPAAKQLADTLRSTWDTAESSASSALAGMVEGTKNWRQASIQLYNSVVDSFVQGISKMVIQHLFGETAKTGATQTGTMARTMWHNLETMAHNLGVMLRTLFHIQGETTATATTTTETGTRIGQHAAAAGSGAAESQASIPYVGPILAVAAMAAIVAAVLALRGGFEAGGFTGPGGRSQPAGIVHAGEYVFNQEAVNRIGLPMLNDLHNGAVSPEAAQRLAASGGGGASAAASSQAAKPEMHFHALFDKEDIRKIAQSQGGEHWVLDVVSQNIHKFR